MREITIIARKVFLMIVSLFVTGLPITTRMPDISSWVVIAQLAASIVVFLILCNRLKSWLRLPAGHG
jgi:hypothetical protein